MTTRTFEPWMQPEDFIGKSLDEISYPEYLAYNAALVAYYGGPSQYQLGLPQEGRLSGEFLPADQPTAGASFSMVSPAVVQPVSTWSEVKPMPLGPGSDLRDFETGVGVTGASATAFGGPLVGAGVIGLRALLARLPAAMQAAVAAAIRSLGAVGTRVGWNRLPTWVQSALTFAGITAGLDILIDTGPDDIGLVQLPGTSDLSVSSMMGASMGGITIVGQWRANGVQFVKLSDGRLGAQNKRGMWKFWRPKKPIVLFATGATNLNTLLRADAVLNAQAKRLKKMLARRAPGPARRGKAVRGEVIAVDGTKVIRNG